MERMIVGGLRNGNNIRTICAAVGISLSTWSRWRKDDPDFKADTDKAGSEGIMGYTAIAAEIARNKKDDKGHREYPTSEQSRMVRYMLGHLSEEFRDPNRSEENTEAQREERARGIARVIKRMDENMGEVDIAISDNGSELLNGDCNQDVPSQEKDPE